jgi:hypothetical protein
MTANDYRGRFPVDVVTDCMGYSGKNAFVYAKPDGGDTAASWVGGFAYFVATDNIYTSSIKISNLLSDVDSSTIYAGSNDATLEKNAERVFSGVYLTYSGGNVYRQLQSTIDAYGRIDASIDMPDIKTAAAATALADRYLNDYSFEEDIINVALLMPADKVNLILEGHAVQIKQTHWLGYEDYVWRRVAQRTVSQTPNPAKYLVNLELRDPRLIVGGNGAIPIPAGDINNQLPPPDTTNTFTIASCADKPATSFAASTYDIVVSANGFAGWSDPAVHPTAGRFLTAELLSNTGGDNPSIGVPPTATFDASWPLGLAPLDAGTLAYGMTVAAGEVCLRSWGGVWHAWPASGNVSNDGSESTGGGRLASWGLYSTSHFGTTIGTYTIRVREYATTTSVPTPPNTGQPSAFETPTPAADGVTVTFTTAFAFFPGTLKVWVNGVDWTENIASVTATTFTLTHAPKTDSDILVSYQGA